jgi:hypothetical protein
VPASVFSRVCLRALARDTAQDLKTTLKKLDEDRSFLCMEDKKAEIKQGFKEKKLKAAAAAGSAAPAVDMQQLERDADAKVISPYTNAQQGAATQHACAGFRSAAGQASRHRQKRKQLGAQEAAGG